MTLRYVYSGLTALTFACVVPVGFAYAQAADGGILPTNESGVVTVAGCLVRGDQIFGGDDDKYVLANPTRGPVEAVSSDRCTADSNANAVQLDNPAKGNVDDSMLGRYVEINGRLEKETSRQLEIREGKRRILRELDVYSARLLPVEAPPRAAAAPEPAPVAAAPEPFPEPAPVATSGQAPAPDLPKTASFGPVAGLLGLLACAAGIALRSFRS
jgi:hypothetical protein